MAKKRYLQRSSFVLKLWPKTRFQEPLLAQLLVVGASGMGTPVTVFQVSHSEKLGVVAETDHVQTKDNTIVGESAWLVDQLTNVVEYGPFVL